MDGSIHTCITDGHLHRVTYARYIDTIDSPDDEHTIDRNMSSIEINVHGKEMCVRLVICKKVLMLLFICFYGKKPALVQLMN